MGWFSRPVATIPLFGGKLEFYKDGTLRCPKSDKLLPVQKQAIAVIIENLHDRLKETGVAFEDRDLPDILQLKDKTLVEGVSDVLREFSVFTEEGLIDSSAGHIRCMIKMDWQTENPTFRLNFHPPFGSSLQAEHLSNELFTILGSNEAVARHGIHKLPASTSIEIECTGVADVFAIYKVIHYVIEALRKKYEAPAPTEPASAAPPKKPDATANFYDELYTLFGQYDIDWGKDPEKDSAQIMRMIRTSKTMPDFREFLHDVTVKFKGKNSKDELISALEGMFERRPNSTRSFP